MENLHQKLIDNISNYIQLNDENIQTIKEYFEPISVAKYTTLEKENTRTEYLYYIIDGYVRVFHIHNGEERTTQINCPSKFITSYQSYITQTKAYDNVQTITDCNLLRISKKNLDILNNKIKNWSIFGEKIYELALIFNEERTRDMILLTAEERYLKLMKIQPDIIKEVPLQFIASYIGIKPESLSRIRRQITF